MTNASTQRCVKEAALIDAVMWDDLLGGFGDVHAAGRVRSAAMSWNSPPDAACCGEGWRPEAGDRRIGGGG